MRLVQSLSLLVLFACGGSSKPATTPPQNSGTADTAASSAASGTTGLPGLDWGATAATVLAANPRATASPDGATAVAPVDGHNAITVYKIGAGGLGMITTEWTDGFVSMDDCAGGFKRERATLDARLGPSQADNLAAYWQTATASITLSCSPNDSGAGVLSLTYAPKTAE